jgi:uncharacterized protein YacL
MNTTLGQVWYYMIYLSDDNVFKFWGYVNMYINSKYMLIFSLLFILVITIICVYTISGIFKTKKNISYIIGLVLSIYLFDLFAKNSKEITHLSWEKAEKVYIEDKSKFDNWEKCCYM